MSGVFTSRHAVALSFAIIGILLWDVSGHLEDRERETVNDTNLESHMFKDSSMEPTSVQEPMANIFERTGSSPQVVVVQAFNQDIPANLVQGDSIGYAWHSAALNLQYAKRHGYAYRMYQLGPGDNACLHDEFGWVPPQWCKVKVLMTAIADFPNSDIILWLDSDATVRNWNISMMQFLKTAPFGTFPDSGHCSSQKPSPMKSEKFSIAAWMNTHWGCGPETGTMIVRRSEAAHELLRTWWGMVEMKGGGPYDQGPFVTTLHPRHHDSITVIGEDSFRDNPDDFIIHRCGSCNWLPERLDIFRRIEQQHDVHISLGHLETLRELVDRSMRHVSPSSFLSAHRGSMGVQVVSSGSLRRHVARG